MKEENGEKARERAVRKEKMSGKKIEIGSEKQSPKEGRERAEG